jgi:hypothetical protein
MYRCFNVMVLAGALSSCAEPDGGGTNERRLIDPLPTDFTDRMEFGLAGHPTPEGFVDFYIGEAAVEAIGRDGLLEVPTDQSWSMIRVPQDLIDRARAGEKVLVPLCDGTTGIVILHNTVDPNITPPEACVNSTMFAVWEQGRMMFEFLAGGEGIFGHVRVGLYPDGSIAVGATVEARPPSICPDNPSGSGAGGFIGAIPFAMPLGDEVPQELRDCRAPPEG